MTSKVGPEGVVRLSQQTDEDRKQDDQKSDVKVIRSLRFKLDGEGFLGELKRHIFLVAIDGGEITSLTEGDWDDSQPSWSPDGTQIAFSSNRTDDREFNRKSDIWIVNVSDGSTNPVTTSDGQYGAPVFSPDGGRLAYIGYPFSETFGPNTISGLWVKSLPDGEPRNIAQHHRP